MRVYIWSVLFAGVASISFGADRISVEDFAHPPAFVQMHISPQGDTVDYVQNINGQQEIVLRDLQTETNIRLEIPASPVPWAAQSASSGWVNSHRLIFKVGQTGFAAIEKDGSSKMGLTGKLGAIERRDNVHLSTSGILHYFRDEEDGMVLMTEYDVPYARYSGDFYVQKFPHVMRINSRNNSKVRVESNPGNIGSWLVDANGVIRVATESKKRKVRTIHRNSAEDKWKALPGMGWEDEATVMRPLGIGSDNQTLYVNRRSPAGMWAVYPYDLGQKKFGEVVAAHEHYDIIPKEGSSYANGLNLQSLIFSPRRELLGIRFMTEFPRVVWFDTKLAEIQKALDSALPRKINTIISMSDDRQRMIVQSWTASDPGTFYLFDAKTPSLGKVLSRMPWIHAEQMAEVSAIKFKARDGLLIHGYLTLPRDRGRKNLPLIVLPHGGPKARDVWSYHSDVQFLANRGYAVLQVNYRGSTGYGQSFLKKGKRQVGEKTQQDITDGVRWAIKRGIADKDRIGIMGGSFGGYSVMMGLAQEPDLYKCGINIAGVTDWITLIKEKARQFPSSLGYNIKLVGHPDKDAEKLEKISPVYLVDAIKAPVLIIHGRDDQSVPYSQAKELVKALDKAGKTYEFMAKYNEQHGLLDFDNRVEMYNRVDAFLQKYLPTD